MTITGNDTAPDMMELTDLLHEQENCHVIDFLPKVMESRDFFELEEFMVRHYIDDFAERIIRIILKLICYGHSQIFLTELPEEYTGLLEHYPAETDLRGLPLEEIAGIIREVVVNDRSSVQILTGSTCRFNISVNGWYSVDVYGLEEETPEYELVKALVQQEGLFLRKAGD
ncbi:MAG: hypothetical protein Q4D24_12420 [Erysipelotrichaceae bacterium]|nr:hypothetical protein [Erysipelotrichaceae bacterium]